MDIVEAMKLVNIANCEAVKANRESMKSIADSTEQIAESTKKTNETLQSMQNTMDGMNKSLEVFAGEMREVHPKMQKTCDEILEKVGGS